MLILLQKFCRRAWGAHGSTVQQFICLPVVDAASPGPFNSNIPRRWKKPIISAQTRLEARTRDLQLDKLAKNLKKLKKILKLHELMTQHRGVYVSVQRISKWRNIIGLNIGAGVFLRKYPHIFAIYAHPVKKKLCCKFSPEMVDLIHEEARVTKETELMVVQHLRKLLMISSTGTLHIHSLWLIRRELGLPDDFTYSVLPKYPEYFRLVNMEVVALDSREESLATAEVEKWREKEFREKWLSEYETKYAFPINLPTGFRIEKGFREKLNNWQRLHYHKPYEKVKGLQTRACMGSEKFGKRAVGIIHEILRLTVDKMVEIERLSYFRKEFNMEVNLRELILKHPGIFYISTKGNTMTVFLREAYFRGCLIESNPIYAVRRKMLYLLLLGCRNSRGLQNQEECLTKNEGISNNAVMGQKEGNCIIHSDGENPDERRDSSDISAEEIDLKLVGSS